MYKLLIIDDQIVKENRKTIYEFMFKDKFHITCVDSSESNINAELGKEYFDCVVLDNNLNSGLDKEAVMAIIAQYKYPIIMVSNVREFTVTEYMRDGVIDFISLNQYFNLREWVENVEDNKEDNKKEKLKEQILKNLHERIIYDIFKARGYTDEEKQNIAICHLSDIQFCDPKTNEASIKSLFNKLEEFIINRDAPIDIVVISGDIVFSGKKKEFQLAEDVISKFHEKLKRQRKDVDILLVPGNHDYDYQCHAGDPSPNSQVDESEEEKIIEKIDSKKGDVMEVMKILREVTITPDLFKDFEANPTSLSNFSKFAYDITKQFQYKNTEFYVTNTKYQKRGFVFEGIDNAYKYHKNMDNSKRYIYELNSDIVENVKAPVFSISVGHVDPRSLGYAKVCAMQEDRCNDELFRSSCSNSQQCEKWGDMQRFFGRVNAIMYLFGHKHCSDIEISQDKKMLFIGAASPTGVSLSEKTVNIIEIQNNKQDHQINANVAVYKATAENISYTRTSQYKYDIEKKEWDMVRKSM